MLLEVKDLRAHYEGVEAIRGVSLEIEEGAIVSIIGANGAGKSTILRAISGLKAPSSGEIWFLDERIDRMPPHEVLRRGIALAPEGKRLFGEMSVVENLQMGSYLRKDKNETRRDIEEVYEHFPRLKERLKQKAKTLSGGEQQMLALGRALMSRPKLLLLDEPSVGLAPVIVQQIAEIIVNINRGGMSIILVEQNAYLALKLAQKAYVLETGKIVLEGDTKTLSYDERVKKAYLGD
jgi:branched-chain amino acid transport system ATP-binding protein